MPSKILLVDDEKLIVKGIKFGLEQDGMDVVTCHDGEEALAFAKEENFDLLILDIMLPKMSGLDVCRAVREFSNVPIIMLTAKTEDMDKIMGLEYGADDYITKPFNILELKARIRAVLRRSKLRPQTDSAVSIEEGNVIFVRGLKIDTNSRKVHLDGRSVGVTAKEFDLLEILVSEAERTFTREELLQTVWGYDYPGDVRTVDVHIRRLREKIEANPSQPKYIHTKWGVGYFFR
ncbi:MAG: response regulator transcription factor, partial [Defluviitaleaceae bacterium]|nr:response regulator transcription factor [Defluviitaleaceae bacterium]